MATKPTVRVLRIIMPMVALLSLIVFPPWELVGAWLRPLPDTVQAEVDRAIDRGFDGIIVYVDAAGQAPAWYTAGWHDRKNKIPADPQALFKIASISKLYTAVAIAKLVHRGTLSLDTTLATYFPELVGRIEHAEKITLRMLVQHRSGIPNLTDTPDFWTNPPASSEEALARVLDLPASFEPGEAYAYSNTNYLLLAELIQRVTGQRSFQYIQAEILRPLGLENTFGSIREVEMDRVMSGYYVGVAEDVKTTDYGSMLATARDVGVFLRALNDGSVFAPGEADIYSSIYGYEHTGLIPGYQSIAKYHPDIDVVVIQFTNTTDFSANHWTLSEIGYNRIVKILRKQTDS